MRRRELLGRSADRRFSLDVAEHLHLISQPPPLPSAWRMEIVAALADDAAIGGDFAVTTLSGSTGPTGWLRAMVVDASGKGAEAATRCVMLAAAIDALLAELPLEAVLPAVDRHVARLGSDEDFATAALLELSLASGEFSLAVAGHPSPAQFVAGSGKWRTYEATGPALGLLPDAEWTFHSGVISSADALIVVTDGVVEVPGSDVDWGIDRLLGHAERLVLTGWQGGADDLLAQRKNAGDDDAQVLVLSRRHP